MEEKDIRLELYHMMQEYSAWPIHGRDAVICQVCHNRVFNFEVGRPDLINLNPLGPGSVIECKAVNLNTAKSFAFALLKPEQRKWLDGWETAGGHGYIGLGTVGTMKREIWLIDWAVWKSLEMLAGIAGKKSVGIARLQEDYKPWQLIRKTGGWNLPEAHSLLSICKLPF